MEIDFNLTLCFTDHLAVVGKHAAEVSYEPKRRAEEDCSTGATGNRCFTAVNIQRHLKVKKRSMTVSRCILFALCEARSQSERRDHSAIM